MTPTRILILLLLFYILYRLLFKKKRVAQKPPRPEFVRPDSQQMDVLVEDPICHTFVPKRLAVTRYDGDETLYFCSDKCYEAFLSQKGDG